MNGSTPGSADTCTKSHPSSRGRDRRKAAHNDDGSNEKEATDYLFAHGGARRGFAGKLESARATAPDGATQGDIQDIAWVAWDGSCDPAEVWAEREP